MPTVRNTVNVLIVEEEFKVLQEIANGMKES